MKLGDIEFAALMVLKDKRKNGPLFFKYSRASRIKVNDYWKEMSNPIGEIKRHKNAKFKWFH